MDAKEWVTEFTKGMKTALEVDNMLVAYDAARQRWNIILFQTRWHLVSGSVSDIAVVMHIKEDPYKLGYTLVMSATDGLPQSLLPETKQITDKTDD